jgi:hypothetical protein
MQLSSGPSAARAPGQVKKTEAERLAYSVDEAARMT